MEIQAAVEESEGSDPQSQSSHLAGEQERQILSQCPRLPADIAQNLPINQLEFHIQSGFMVLLNKAFKRVGMVSFPGWNTRLKEIVYCALLAAFLG